MIRALGLILSVQLAGEALARAAGLPVPGPVLGMALLLALLAAAPPLAALVRPVAQGILGTLGLLFVPAGVGVVGHAARLGADGVGLAVAIVLSTGLAIAAGALAFVAVARLSGSPPDA